LLLPLPIPTGGSLAFIGSGSFILISSSKTGFLGLIVDGGATGSSGNSSARDLYLTFYVL
jgi:hypothetical protein